MIIVEGPDGSGKTTFAHKLAEALGSSYRKPPPEVLSSTTGPAKGEGLAQWWIDAMVRQARTNDVYDRTTIISDPIYCAVQARKPSCTANQIMYMLAYVNEKVSHVVFCRPTDKQIMDNLKSNREQLKGVGPKKMAALIHAYDVAYTHWAYMFPGKIRRMLWTNESIVINNIVKEIRGAHKRSSG